MSDLRLSSLTNLATRMRIDPLAAVALPSVVTVAARKAGMTEAAMIAECGRNARLREYLAGICRNTDVVAALS